MNDFRKLAEILKKAGGEGSRGGHIIGHTRSGQPIYSSASHAEHRKFNSQGHADAMNQHHAIWSKTQNKIAAIKQKKPNWNPPKQVNDFLNHHFTQMRIHQNQASVKMDQERRTKEALTPKPENVRKGLNDIEVPFMAAVVVISPDKKKVLLGKRSKDGDWESPAGHADIGEHPEDVVIRECFEEFNIPLKPEQLEHLPMMYKKDMVPIHCFMAVTEKYQIEKISCEDDPSEEHTKWKWFELDEKLPDEMEDNRFNLIIHAKMKLAGITEMAKSFLNMDEMEGMSAVNTADVVLESGSLQDEQNFIERHMAGYESGDEPRMIPVDESVLYLVRVDDGLYSGFVKREDPDGLLETVANIDKLTIPALVQFLRAKQIIRPAKRAADPEKSLREDELKRLLNQLMVNQSKMIYVSMDGDNIGNRVAQAEARDDEHALMEFSRRINAGQTVFHTWAHSVGGSIIEGGGDEALAKVPESAKEKIEFFRSQYEQIVGATVTVGVGDSISQATKARELGKLKGKNRTEVFMPGSDEELQRLFKPVDAAQKLRDSGVLGLSKALRQFRLERLNKGGPLPLGTVRQWGVNKYVKHEDGWVVVGGEHHGKLMGNFLDKPTHADYARHHSKSSVREDSENGSADSAKKSVAAELLDLSKKLQCGEDLQKGHPMGTVRMYAGMKYMKQHDGHWMPMLDGSSSDENHLKVHQAEPSSISQPKQEHEGATSEIPMSMADQSGDSQMNHVKESKEKPESDVSVGKQNEQGSLSHLEPREGFGGHVQLHSKDLKQALDKGPFSIISGGRNHNDPEDRGMTDEQVSKRHKKLEEELKESGHKYSKIRREGGGKEDAFMVHHADEGKMNELGKKYNQEKVIHSKGGKHKMAFVNGQNEGKWHGGNGYQEVPDAADYYTQIDTSDGQRKKLDLNFDYGKYHGIDGTVD